jgi:diguanylate cyclase (GGDEF)-like protein
MNVANRNRKEMGLVFIDMDGMKQINDTFGHPEGDAALRETADILREAFRESDVIARMGGDEFAVLITEIAGIKNELIAHRLQEHVDARNAQGKGRYRISLSAGVVRYDPQNPCTLADLVAKADTLMYSHKQSKKIIALKSQGGLKTPFITDHGAAMP